MIPIVDHVCGHVRMSYWRSMCGLMMVATCGSGLVAAADFDCAAAQTPVERLICATPELGAMDEDMGLLYRHLDSSRGADRERAAQRQWLRQRNACGPEPSCIRAAYVSRIGHLLGVPELTLPEQAGLAVAATKVRLKSGWVIDDQEQPASEELCPKLRDHMNREAAYWWRTEDSSYISYCSGAARLAPIFEQPPWRELNPGAHFELIVRLLTLRSEYEKAYFLGPRSREEAYYREKAKEFVSSGGTLKVWATHLLDWVTDIHTGKTLASQKQVQQVAQLGFASDPATDRRYRSAGCQHRGFDSQLFLLTDDLKDPAPVVAIGLELATLVRYRGQPVLVTTDSAELSLDFPLSVGNAPSCKLKFIKELEQPM